MFVRKAQTNHASNSIEDNILITETGFENLTTTVKAPAEVEAFIGQA